MNGLGPQLHYLLHCSSASLEAFELARLNRIANLRKEFDDLVGEWIEAEVEARLSRWILDMRREPISTHSRPLDSHQPVLPFPDTRPHPTSIEARLEHVAPPAPTPPRLNDVA